MNVFSFLLFFILNHLIVVACGRVVGGEEVGYRDTRRGLNELRVFLLIVVVVNVDDNDDVVVVFSVVVSFI